MTSQVVLITGAGSGFGLRTAKALLARGHTVLATMRDPRGKDADAVQSLQEADFGDGASLYVFPLDVIEDASIDAALREAEQVAAPIDVLINNAGIWGPGVLEAFTMAQWQALFDVNLFGSVRLFRAVLPSMRARKSGLIVQISSLQGRFVLPYSGPYVASKFAVEGMAETFRAEVSPFEIEVCIVEPFDYMTEMKVKAHEHTAQDAAVQDAYGVGAFIEAAYLTPNSERSRDPTEVVEALVELVETPAGRRPFRVTVGNPLTQIEHINRLTDEMHAELYPMIGLAHLAPHITVDI